jgi:YHS domain-containing protein
MRTSVKTPLLATALVLGLTTAGFAATGQFDDMCAMGLSAGKEVKTDCSVNATYEGKTYCFGDEASKAQFMANPAENLAKAKQTYKEHQG